MKINTAALYKWAIAVLTVYMGEPAMQALLIFLILDYLTGLAAAFVRRELSSDIGWRGLVKKCMIILLVFSVRAGEKFMPEVASGIQVGGVALTLSSATASGYALNEAISIVENCYRAGVPIPSAVVNFLLGARKLFGEKATADDIKKLAG